jgi:hypothetical protein
MGGRGGVGGRRGRRQAGPARSQPRGRQPAAAGARRGTLCAAHVCQRGGQLGEAVLAPQRDLLLDRGVGLDDAPQQPEEHDDAGDVVVEEYGAQDAQDWQRLLHPLRHGLEVQHRAAGQPVPLRCGRRALVRLWRRRRRAGRAGRAAGRLRGHAAPSEVPQDGGGDRLLLARRELLRRACCRMPGAKARLRAALGRQGVLIQAPAGGVGVLPRRYGLQNVPPGCGHAVGLAMPRARVRRLHRRCRVPG